MGQVVQLGQINTTALVLADVYVQIVPPQFLLNGLPTNIIGVVGTASWGAVNAATIAGPAYSDYVAKFGQMVPRKYDIGTHIWTSYMQGGQAIYRIVRVSDGTDTAATTTIQTNCLTVTSKYTGSAGNGQSVRLDPGTAVGSWKITLNTPGQIPEQFDNITQGIQTIAVVPGTGYTSVPAATVAAPALPTTPGGAGRNALVNPTLKLLAAPTVAAGGAGYIVGEVITLPNNITLTVATITAGAVATVTLTNPGSLQGAGTLVPANPVAQSSSSGAGTGATFTLGTWGLGTPAVVDPGAGYTNVPAITLIGGGGTGGTLTATLSFWANLARAINSGISGLRGPSQTMIATNGAGTATPVASLTQLVGGTDGANVTSFALIGVDSIPRKGMYALRGTGCSIGLLSDVDDSTTWSTQVSFGLAEGVYMIATGPNGDSISNATTVKANAGIDSYALKLMFGDWVYLLDSVNSLTRLVSPQGYVAGVLGNLAPNQSSLNKPMQGIVGTQKSLTGVPYAAGDLSTLAQNGIDIITNPIPAGNMFGCRSGRNTSSNAAIRGDNYTRMTNYIAFTIAAGVGIYVGQLQTKDERRRAKVTLDQFFYVLQSQGLIGTPSGEDAWQVQLDENNNPPARVALGYQQADVKVVFLSVIEFFLINIEGGQTVTIERSHQTLPVTNAVF